MQTLPETLNLPPHTISRAGAVMALHETCEPLGPRGMLVHGRSLETRGTLPGLLDSFSASATVVPWCHPGGEPTLDQLEALLTVAREFAPDWIAAIGGGSVMDIAKAGAGLLEAPLPPRAYHDGEPIPSARIPFVAVPTTAGTGSEVTYISVLTNRETGVKKSIRHPSFLPRAVILDPELLYDCPRNIVAASGMDALTQAVESYVSTGATWFSDAFALEAVKLVNAGLPEVFHGRTGEAAMQLLQGSYMAGVALSHSRLGVVHGLAHPLGCRYHVAHGLACAVCLPPALAFNREAMGAKYAALGGLVGGDLLEHVSRLLDELGITSPFAGQPVADRDAIVRETLASGSTRANPRPVGEAEAGELLDAIFGT